MSDQPQAIVIEYKRTGKASQAIVTAKDANGPIYVDRFDFAKDKLREQFLDILCGKRPGIDRANIAAQLLACSTEVADEAGEPSGGRSDTIADQIVELLQKIEGVELFHTPELEPYAVVPVAGHREIWKIHTKGFKDWLARRFYQAFGKVPNSNAMTEAGGVIAGLAKFEGSEHEIEIRIAEHAGSVWLDLCDDEWRAVQITSTGWRIVPSNEVPVRFIRRRGMQALPAPVAGGSLDEMRKLVNLPDDRQWTLYVGWLIGTLRPKGPFGVLAVAGEHGSAKSTTSRLARRLIDPNLADLRRPPKDERDVFIAGSNSWIYACNNLSGLKPHLSDALCALATDGGFATRELYSNDDEAIFSARRPVMLNGIEPPATRPDLVDRCISLILKPIPEEARLEEDDIYAQFEEVRPRVLGALLTGVSSALRNRHNVKLPRKPRMADLAVWVTAAEEGLGWKPGRFIEAFMENRADAQADTIENSAIGPTLVALLERGKFDGTATELLAAINTEHGAKDHPDGWPNGGVSMANQLRRLAPVLRAVGFKVEIDARGRGHKKQKLIHLEKLGQTGTAYTALPANEADAEGAVRAESLCPTQSEDLVDEDLPI